MHVSLSEFLIVCLWFGYFVVCLCYVAINKKDMQIVLLAIFWEQDITTPPFYPSPSTAYQNVHADTRFDVRSTGIAF